jgi:hypothetical protein
MRRPRTFAPTLDGLETRTLLSVATATQLSRKEPGLVRLLNDSRSTAQNLGALSSPRTINGSVGGSDPRDYFRFTVGQGRIEVRLTGLQADIDFELLRSNGSRIGSAAANAGTSSELKTYTLSGGTYYVNVYPGVSGASSTYKLSLKVLPTGGGGLGLTPQPSALSQRVVDYLNANRGRRIGGGECAHLATEALRVAGAQFVRTASDFPGPGDYVWGNLVKVVSATSGRAVDSSPSTAVLPGDVIQYRNAAFSTGSRASHHTSVVAEVDANGRPTKVYEQNLGNSGTKGVNRTATLRPFDMTKLTSGFIRIYRPQARTTTAGRYEFTIVNNTSSSQRFEIFGKASTLGPDNTASSYTTYWTTGSRPRLTLNGRTYDLVNGAGYRIVGSGSSATLQKLTA